MISQQAITRYKLAHSFPIGKEASFADIATTTGLDQGLVRRFIRHAIVKNIFLEPRPGIVTHNAVSRILAEDNVVHDWVGASTDDLWQAAAQTCNAIDKWSASQEPNETVSEDIHLIRRIRSFDLFNRQTLISSRGLRWQMGRISPFTWNFPSTQSAPVDSAMR